jgi:hypothetical protein
MPTNATRPTVANRKLFIILFLSIRVGLYLVPANDVAGVAMIPTRESYVLWAKSLVPKWQHSNAIGERFIIVMLIIVHMARGAVVHPERSARPWNLRFIRSSLTAGQDFPLRRQCLVPVLLQAMTECFPMGSRVSANEE